MTGVAQGNASTRLLPDGLRSRGRTLTSMLLFAGPIACTEDDGASSTAGDTTAVASSGDPGTTDASHGATTSTGGPADTTAGASSGRPATTSSSESGASTSASTSDESGGASECMICQPACTVPADCCPPPDQTPPGISCPEDFPFNFVCPDGVCRPGGCSSDADCAYFPGPTQICVDAFGLGRCRRPCESDTDCEKAGPGGFPLACDGVTDRGASYCGAIEPPDCSNAPEPGPRCALAVCPCIDDGDCQRGWGCTPSW